MSKNIRIKQNGVVREFPSTQLIGTRTNDGTGEWVPKDEHVTTIKQITLNGQYKASKDNVKGYTAVIVNVKRTKITGVDKEDGETYEVTVDNEGYLSKTKISKEEQNP
jgi:hypothetical protein